MIKKILFNILVMEVILFSGGLIFTIESTRMCMSLFLVTSFLYCLLTNAYRTPFFLKNVTVCLVLCLFVFFSTFIFNSQPIDNSYLQYILYSLSMCLFVSAVSFEQFRKRLLFYFNCLCFLSIVVQLFYDMGFVSATYQTIGEHNRTMALGAFQVLWGGENRLSGIYWEPGQYQIVIIFILCLFIDKIKELNLKTIIKDYGLMVVALFMTRSTTGYIAFALYIFVISFFSNITKSYKILMPICVVLSVFIGYLIFSGSVVQEKFAQDEDASSYMIRMADNQALLKITMENPFCGLGVETKQLKIQKKQYGSETSSNGWLNASASLGLLYVGFIFVCMYKRIKEMNFNVPILLIMLVLFVSQCNEAALYLPYIYMYIYKYADYSMKQKQNNDGKKTLVYNNNKL